MTLIEAVDGRAVDELSGKSSIGGGNVMMQEAGSAFQALRRRRPMLRTAVRLLGEGLVSKLTVADANEVKFIYGINLKNSNAYMW
jgi:hypothetical protein